MGRDKSCPYGVILSQGEGFRNALDEPKASGKRAFRCPPDKSGSSGGLTPAELDVVRLRASLRRKNVLRASDALVGACLCVACLALVEWRCFWPSPAPTPPSPIAGRGRGCQIAGSTEFRFLTGRSSLGGVVAKRTNKQSALQNLLPVVALATIEAAQRRHPDAICRLSTLQLGLWRPSSIAHPMGEGR